MHQNILEPQKGVTRLPVQSPWSLGLDRISPHIRSFIHAVLQVPVVSVIPDTTKRHGGAQSWLHSSWGTVSLAEWVGLSSKCHLKKSFFYF